MIFKRLPVCYKLNLKTRKESFNFYNLKSFNPADSATEFNDSSIISCLTGWLPEPLPLRFGHITEVWKFLKETLPKFQWNDEKPKITSVEEEQIFIMVCYLKRLFVFINTIKIHKIYFTF